MRFKTKDLMINVHPGEFQAEACLYNTEARQEHVICYQHTPNVCPWFTRPCHWGTPCLRPTPYCHPTPWVACEHGTKPELCAGASPFVQIDDITKYIRHYTPRIAQEPEQVEFLKQELATTLEMLDQIEPLATPERLAEVKKVEAGLVEALAQVRAQKQALSAKKTTRKK